MLTCGSPQLIAAYRVLHRQSVPWHPPCALVRLILPVHVDHLFLRLLREIINVDCLLFVSSLCSFQGAYPLPMIFQPKGFRVCEVSIFHRSFKTIQKSFILFSQILTPAFSTDYLFDTLCRCCRLSGLPVFPASCN